MMSETKYDTQQTVICCHCGKSYTVHYNQADYNDWLAGHDLIQNALHYMSAADRELLLSRTCDPCWIKLFGDSKDEG